MKKYVFLDLDGVCSNYTDTPGSYITHKPEDYGMSEINLNRIKSLCENTGAKIVISSNWRKFSEDPSDTRSYWNNVYGKILNPLPSVKKFFGELIIGILPKTRHITKSQALSEWFIENKLNPETVSYVIFDDDLREGFDNGIFKKHFILTNPEYGVSDENIKQAKEIF